uniref:Uncharacterized protein n=1 Tax=Oryza rufipogon TaxID=4529 RepID=A0A0E0RBH5_ORYRU
MELELNGSNKHVLLPLLKESANRIAKVILCNLGEEFGDFPQFIDLPLKGKYKYIYPLLNEVDLGAFTNCSSALGTLKPSRTVLRLFIDLEMWLMMMMTMDLHKLFFGPLTDDDALHKLFFGPSLIDDDHDDKLRHGDDEVTMKASSNGELVMMKANSDRELVV